MAISINYLRLLCHCVPRNDIEVVNHMIKVQMVHVPGCTHCVLAKKIIEDLKPTYPQIELSDIDATTVEGMELVGKYSIMASPGIIINGELFATGGLDKNKFIQKMESILSRG